MNTTKNTTPKPTLSSQEALQEALVAVAAKVELPTIRWDATSPERKPRRQIDREVVGMLAAALIALVGLSR